MSREKRKDELVVLFDIGSGSVGGAIAELPKAGKKSKFNPLYLRMEPAPELRPRILYSARTPIDSKGDFNFEMFLFEMSRALEETARKLENARLGPPARIFCFLAAPWFGSQTRIIKFKKNSSFIFNKKMASELVQKEIKAFKRDYGRAEEGAGEEMRILEENIVKIKLNGYDTNNPFGEGLPGRRTKEIELALYLSISQEKILNSIEYQIQKVFNSEINFQSFLFSAYIVLRDLPEAHKDFLLVDVAGEVTDLGLSRGDVLEETISFPFGRNHLIRQISKQFNSDSHESSAMLSLYLNGCLEKSVCAELAEVLERSRRDWLDLFRNALSDISGGGNLPRKIYLTADQDIAPWFKKTVAMEEFGIDVIMIESGELERWCADRSDSKDPFLLIETLFINKLK